MVDFHTHILPGIDDGASDVEESLEMIKCQVEQGVNTIVATPHFLPDDMNIDEFYAERNNAFQCVKNAAKLKNIQLPNIILGAEVKLMPFVSRMPDISKLCIEGTNLIMIELPYDTWSDNWVFDEIFSLIVHSKLTPVIAHINRYITKSTDFKKLEKLFRMEVYLQINIGSYLDKYNKKNINRLIKNGNAHVVASDCHNMDKRPPTLVENLKNLEKKFGKTVVETFNENALYLLNLQ